MIPKKLKSVEKLYFGNFLTYFLILTSHYSFGMNPNFAIWEIASLVASPFISIRKLPFPQYSKYRLLNLTLYLWIFATISSSFFNQLDFRDSLVLIGEPVITLATIKTVVWLICIRDLSINTFLLLFSLSGLIFGLVQKTEFTNVNIWKFSVGFYICVLALTFLKKDKSSVYLSVTVSGLLVYVSLVNGARAIGAFVSLVLLINIRKSKIIGPKSANQKWKSIIFITISMTSIYFIYLKIAGSGILGIRELKRSEILSGQLGPLAGRSEFLYSIPAFLEKPWFGFGNVNRIPPEFILERAAASRQFGLSPIGTYGIEVLPIHSYIMQSLVLSGFISILFWIVATSIVINGFFKVRQLNQQHPYSLSFLLLWSTWGFFFSPYASNERLILCLSVVLALIMISRNAKSDKCL